MRIIGLTGGIGTGKSTVADMLRESNIPVIDLDKVGHEIILKGKKAYGRIIEEFGKDIIDKDGEIDRKKLGKIVFDDKEKLTKLNDITHKEILSLLSKKIAILEKEGNNLVVVEIPLLFELNLENLFDEIVVVYAPLNVQLERLMKRENISEGEALKKIGSQMPIDKKLSKEVYVIDNSKDIEHTREQVNKLIEDWNSLLIAQ